MEEIYFKLEKERKLLSRSKDEWGAAINSIPIYHNNKIRPYGECWIFILIFSIYSGITMSVLIGTSTSASMTILTLVSGLTSAFYIPIVLFFQFPLVTCPSLNPAVVSQYRSFFEIISTGFSLVYGSTYIIAYHILVPDSILPPTSYIAICGTQALVFTGWLLMYSRPVVPESVRRSDDFELLKFYLNTWWRLVRLGIAAVFTISVGLTLSLTLNTNLQLNNLLINAIILVPISFPSGHYVYQKTVTVGRLAIETNN